VWARTPLTSVDASGTSTNSDALVTFTTALGSDLIGTTIVRVRGVLRAAVPTLSADTLLVVGLRIVDQLSAPTDGPITAPHDDWFMYWPFTVVNSTAGSGGNATVSQEGRIDNQSSRKLDEVGQMCQLCIQASAGTTWDVALQLSLLLMLH